MKETVYCTAEVAEVRGGGGWSSTVLQVERLNFSSVPSYVTV
jgi:hypothetical protein